MNGNNRIAIALGVVAYAAFIAAAQDSSQRPEQSAPQIFDRLCAGCHGDGGAGGDRAPALVNNRSLRTRSQAQIEEVIRSGTQGGMPAFRLPGEQVKELAGWLRSLNLSAFETKPPGNIESGERFFFGAGACATCHMVRGRGHTNGPDLSEIGRKSTVRELELVLENPTSQMGIHTTPDCPAWAFCPDETWGVVDVLLRDNSSIRGFARKQTNRDIEVQDFQGRMHFLTSSEYEHVEHEKASYMPPFKGSAEQRRDLIAYLSSLGTDISGPLPKSERTLPLAAERATVNPAPGEWPNYDGAPRGNRYSPLDDINRRNIGLLKLEWVYSLPSKGLEMTPIVSDEVMYVTAPEQVCAIDARSGREIWCYVRPADSGPAGRGNQGRGNGSGGEFRQPNRGATLVGDRVLFVTGDAHLVCLNRVTGGVMWDVSMPETPGHYSATSAPLVIGDLVVSGIAGGDGPLRGFIAAYEIATGQLAWRFWTIPKPGEPGSETWVGDALPTGGGATWVTGSYDSESDTLYWTVGNPFPATDGDERRGTNLYTNCVLALEGRTGRLRWYYQFTPHDLHDWDATEPVVLADADWRGEKRKLLIQANRNGYLYVLDRSSGKLLLAKPFVDKLNWSSGIGEDGKPVTLPANFPTRAGVKTCPAVRGATNWYSTSFSPESRLFYVMAVEDCSIYRQAGRGGYEGYRNPLDPGRRYLRAIDIETGRRVWEAPQIGAQEANYTGVLATAAGIVFYGETGGSFAAADSKTGKLLWSFTANEPWKASPMTYLAGGRQFVAIVSGGNVLSFALPASGRQ